MRVMIFAIVGALCALSALTATSVAQTSLSACEELVLLFIELAERSGQVVTIEEARAEVMSENPTNEDCAGMLALFPKQD